jgi:hypothetical protein
LWPLGIYTYFIDIWYIFLLLVCCAKETSGNPGLNGRKGIWQCNYAGKQCLFDLDQRVYAFGHMTVRILFEIFTYVQTEQPRR